MLDSFYAPLWDYFLLWLLAHLRASEALRTGAAQRGAGAAQERRAASPFSPGEAAGLQRWPPAPAAPPSGHVSRCFLKHSASSAPQQTQLWGLWRQREGRNKGTAGRGKAARVTHDGRDHCQVTSNGICNSREKNVKMLYKSVCITGKNNRNLGRGSKQVFGHMQEKQLPRGLVFLYTRSLRPIAINILKALCYLRSPNLQIGLTHVVRE